MEYTYNFKIQEESVGIRLDIFLAKNLQQLSRSNIQKLIETKNILINSKPTKSNYKLRLSDIIYVTVPTPKHLNIIAENIPLNIIYEDEHLIVVNKAKGMVVHPAPGHYSGTLVNALLYHCGKHLSGINGVMRPGIVHRIDKDTSGIIVVAKSDKAHQSLVNQLSNHSMTRRYNALTFNNIKEDNITINAPIGRHPIDRKKMCVTTKNSKNAVTHIHVLERLRNYTLVEASLDTGRTHQIRVHMSYKGFPLIGDTVYGKAKQPFNTNGQVLHAKVLGFVHPISNEYMEFSSSLPKYFELLLEKLRNHKL